MKIPAWSCLDERWNSRKNLVAYDDRGTLEYGNGGWIFHGRKHQSHAVTITDVELSRPAFPWIAQIVGFAILIAAAVVASVLLRDPEFSMLMGIGMSGGFVLGIVVNRAQEWVVVTGLDADGNTVTGRFHDAGAFGWMGLVGGNHRLADALKDHRAKEE